MEIDFFKLLLRYNSLPPSERHLSIFDVAGYPHYENVCSNVLKFYLDPREKHGLGSLVLTSLLSKTEHNVARNAKVEIFMEYSTIDGGRLDLLLVSDAFVIGVENKIFHSLHNHLPDYRNTIDRYWRQSELSLV